jgi:TRAP-type C4-dicarboxylate transport system permease small subunit
MSNSKLMHNEPGISQIIKKIDRFGHFLETVFGAFCVFLFAGMIGVTLLGVFFRYIMLNPFPWTEELARFLMVFLAFLAMSIAMRREQHITIKFAVDRLSQLSSKLSMGLAYIVDLLIAFFLILLLKQGYLMTTKTIMTASTIDISMFWPYLAVPLGALLTLTQLLLNTVKRFLSDMSGVARASV